MRLRRLVHHEIDACRLHRREIRILLVKRYVDSFICFHYLYPPPFYPHSCICSFSYNRTVLFFRLALLPTIHTLRVPIRCYQHLIPRSSRCAYSIGSLMVIMESSLRPPQQIAMYLTSLLVKCVSALNVNSNILVSLSSTVL